MIGHAILLHSLCKVQKAAGMACIIKLMYLHDVCGSRINSCEVHDLTLTTWLTVDDVEGGVGFEKVTSVSEVGVIKVEGIDEMSPVWVVTVWGVGGVSVGGVAPVDAEVLLSEKQGIVTVKMDPPKMVPQNYFLRTSWNLSYCKILPLNIWTTSKRWNNEDSFTCKIWTLSFSLCQLKGTASHSDVLI